MQDENGESKKCLPDSSKQALQIKNSINGLEKELDVIQNDCNHPEYEIKNCQSNSIKFSNIFFLENLTQFEMILLN